MNESDKGIDYPDDDVAIIPSTPKTTEPTIQSPSKSSPLGSVPTTQFICPTCGRVFTTQNTLSIHRGIAHKHSKKANNKR